MVREIYGRDPSDPHYTEFEVETTSALEAVLTKLRIIFFTSKGEVLGYPEFGLDLDALLFEFQLNEVQIESKINEQIAEYVPEASSFEIRVEVKFYEGDFRDAALIDIFVDKEKYLGIYAE
jgi:hypothetical protein